MNEFKAEKRVLLEHKSTFSGSTEIFIAAHGIIGRDNDKKSSTQLIRVLRMQLAILYAVLAAISTAFNIGSQDVVVRLYSGPYSVTLSILVGTGVGLLVKYCLDKRYIFKFKAVGVAHDARTFILYAFMGVFTTVIFWGFEFGFHHLFQSKELRYLGGVIGLAIGYVTKYQLDKKFVFCNPKPYGWV